MKQNGHEYVYVRYSREQPQLPELITDTIDEMAKTMGKKKETISAYMARNCSTYRKVRIS